MSPDLRRCLDRAVADAAAAIAFVDAQPVEPEAHPATWVHIPLIAPAEGTLALGLAPEVVDEMTRTAWGAFASGEADQQSAFLFEFLNVIAGRLLAELDPHAEARLGFPRIAGEPPTVVAQYDLEGHRLSVGWLGAA